MAKINMSPAPVGVKSSQSEIRLSDRRKIPSRGMLLVGASAVLLLAVGPFLFGTYLLNVLIQAFFFSIVAVTVDILWAIRVT